ncbi:uncharacterized protein LOC141643752 [Silene latifolia]|uniref:uncharacterized protein LOC141643752 n=1 Tax=Silene latifolia TaxID=37657 RepID=UPI003D778C05
MEQPTQKTIAEIQEGDFNVYMKVRVIRKWKKQEWNNHGKGIFHKVEFLMVDEENNVVQGLITKSLIKKYDGRIQEGKTYKIGRFQTVRNHGFHLATTHKYRIRFGTRTTIDEIECGSIPKHGFKFVSFEDIISNKLEGRQLIDVIGGVEDYNAVFVHNNTKRMALDLANQDDTQLSFWMWGPYTKDGEHIATNLCHKSEKPVIVMQCVERIVTKGGHIRLSTVDDVSKIYVNPEIPEAHYIRTRLSARPGRSKGVVESKNKTILDESCKTLHEIMCTELAGKYVTVAYLNEIDDTFGWYRNICQKCTSPVGKRHGKWYCSDKNCITHEEGSENRATRFKVRFIISDDNGAKANLIMYDKQIKKKVAKTPLECLDKLHQVGNVRGVPQELTSMLRKKYVLELVVDKRYNLELSLRCYTVVDYSDELKHIEAWTEQYKMIQEKIQYENQVLAASNAEDDSAVKGIHNDESVEKILTLNMTQESVVTTSTRRQARRVTSAVSVKIDTQYSTPTTPLSSTTTGIDSPPDVVERLVRDLCSTFGESYDECIDSPPDVVERLVRDLCLAFGESYDDFSGLVSENQEVFTGCEMSSFRSHGECSRSQQNQSSQGNDGVLEGYWDIGDPEYECTKCRAQMWFQERKKKKKGTRCPKLSLCCSDGKVKLPWLKEPRQLLKSLLSRQHPFSKHFIENIWAYNGMFSFTSMGGKIDHSINQGRGPYTFRMGGQNIHRIGSLLSSTGATLKFCQLYIYDTEEEVENRKKAISNSENPRDKLTLREWYAFRIPDRPLSVEFPTHKSGKAYHQFLVDGFASVESHRLKFIRYNQDLLRVDNYNNLRRVIERGDVEPSSAGSRLIVPSSLVGGGPYMRVNYLDTMTICRWFGYPDLFITFTCNPKWPEITRFVKNRGLNPEDRPDILSRVFKIKLEELMIDLKERHIFGRVRADLRSFISQKRGLPHAHILLFLHREDKFPEAADIDKIISAEIPNPVENPMLHAVVCTHMIHGPCGTAKPRSPCMVGSTCSKHFPKKCTERTTIGEGDYPIYKRSKTGPTIYKDQVALDNGSVVPYNPYLLLKYRAHINVEWCNQSKAIKYLFKYINKGSDRVTMQSSYRRRNDQFPEQTPMHRKAAAFTFPANESVVFYDEDPIDEVLEKSSMGVSKFLSWMKINSSEEEELQIAKDLLYCQFPTKFVWNKDQREWTLRKQNFKIGRLQHVPPTCGELYFMRTMLNHVKGPKSYEDIRRVNGTLYDTYREACYAYGLIGDDKEYIDAIEEASEWASGFYLRNLFATLLLSGTLSTPSRVWEATWSLLADDILHRQRNILQNRGLELTDEELKNYALIDIEASLQLNGSSLARFEGMPLPDRSSTTHHVNTMVMDELSYDKESLQAEHASQLSSMTDDQTTVYNEIMEAIASNQGGVFFVYGYGGTGKTFIWRTLCAALRSKGEIVLPVASSGIAKNVDTWW